MLHRLGGLFVTGHFHLLPGVQHLAARHHDPLPGGQALADDHPFAGVADPAHRLQVGAVFVVQHPHRRVPALLEQRRPGQHHAGLRGLRQLGPHHAAQAHGGGDPVEADLHLQRAAAVVDGGGDFADAALDLHGRVGEQVDADRLIALVALEQRFVDVEHGVPLAFAGQGEDRQGGLHHLADLAAALGNDAVGGGLEFGVGELVFGGGLLGKGGVQGALCGTAFGLGAVVFAAAGVALGQQLALAPEVDLGQAQPRLLGRDGGAGVVHLGAQLLRVEAGQDLAGLHPVADVDMALDDLAADAEGLLRLDPRLDVAHHAGARGVVGAGGLAHQYAGQVFLRCVLAAAGQCQRRQAERECGRSGCHPFPHPCQDCRAHASAAGYEL